MGEGSIKNKTEIIMPKITFLPSGITIDVPSGTLLSDAALVAGVMIDLPCGGKGTCGKCLVRLDQGTVAEKPGIAPSDGQRESGFVVACQSSIISDATISIPEQPAHASPADMDDGIDPVCEHAAALPHLSPLTERICLSIPRPGREDGLSDLDRLDGSLKALFPDQDITCPLPVIRKLADALREKDGLVTLTIAADNHHARVIDITSGKNAGMNLGIAVDLGTTTISVALIDLESGKVVSTRNGYNDQIHCGLDVISRINYAATSERLEDLRARAVQSVNRLIEEAITDTGNTKDAITCCRMSGNTIMTHLFAGLRPEYLRLEPYTPTVLQFQPFQASELGLDINPQAFVTLSDCVGSYVGGDITAGLLTTDIAKDTEGICLFMDIGTNGEIVVGNKDFLMTCACSAGPAFEGGGIDCGMRATTGAIDSVSIDPDTGGARYTTIGSGKPSGICGSGMIDLIAGLFLPGWIDPSGKFDRSRPSPFIHIDGRRAYYTLSEARDTCSGRPIILSENDIDNLMRAKAAIYSASSLLLKQVGITFDDISTFSIAGGFGRFLNLDNAMVIGLLPEIPVQKFHYLGNASLSGSTLGLLSKEFREIQAALAGRMTYIDLSTSPGYMDQYMAALFLPHTDQHRFPGVLKRFKP
jgi:uncharacterized 2Fe-2S/4Fe-4S cluster protein (DUF4445 family)